MRKRVANTYRRDRCLSEEMDARMLSGCPLRAGCLQPQTQRISQCPRHWATRNTYPARGGDDGRDASQMNARVPDPPGARTKMRYDKIRLDQIGLDRIGLDKIGP